MSRMAFSVATWNILATSYIRRRFYPGTPPQVLDAGWRVPALARHATTLDVDILCLQEVEPAAYNALGATLGAAAYEGTLARKGRNRPDGCATFFRTHRFTLAAQKRIAYTDGDGGPDSGHIGQLLTLESGKRRLAVFNTHLKWDQPQIEAAKQFGYRQIMQALNELATAGVDGRILCGDFNVTPDSDVIKAVEAAGMNYAHRGRAGLATCNSNREAKLIDYLFFDAALRATPVLPQKIGDDTILPSLEQPSDHLPLAAEFDWADDASATSRA
jgi:mRNA deadenylase 3'-5' endonuclease subunit Ccr4